jgi:hypothetical protein
MKVNYESKHVKQYKEKQTKTNNKVSDVNNDFLPVERWLFQYLVFTVGVNTEVSGFSA